MKFLCVECDEPMSLSETRGPDGGSMTVVFSCPACGRRTAMLTNAMETQVVRSLGVKIGGRSADAEPMEGIRTTLITDGTGPAREGSKCPFTGVVEEAFEQNEMAWTDEARARVERIPSFARRMAMKSVEEFARENGYQEVSVAVLEESRGRMGI